MYTLNPTSFYRYALKKGMTGTDVAALQINLDSYDVLVDGEFGTKTETAVKAFQKKYKLTQDGVAGIQTQEKLCRTRSAAATKAHNLPNGLLPSLIVNESGFAIAAYTDHPSDSGFDLGAYQDSIGPGDGSQARYIHAYDVRQMAEETAAKISYQHDQYTKAVKSFYSEAMANDDMDRYSWCLAVLFHNWEVAASNLNKYGSVYQDSSRDTETEQWIVEASGGRLHTPREWVLNYVQRATVYIRRW